MHPVCGELAEGEARRIVRSDQEEGRTLDRVQAFHRQIWTSVDRNDGADVTSGRGNKSRRRSRPARQHADRAGKTFCDKPFDGFDQAIRELSCIEASRAGELIRGFFRRTEQTKRYDCVALGAQLFEHVPRFRKETIEPARLRHDHDSDDRLRHP